MRRLMTFEWLTYCDWMINIFFFTFENTFAWTTHIISIEVNFDILAQNIFVPKRTLCNFHSVKMILDDFFVILFIQFLTLNFDGIVGFWMILRWAYHKYVLCKFFLYIKLFLTFSTVKYSIITSFCRQTFLYI